MTGDPLCQHVQVFSMTEQSFYQAPPSAGCLDGGYFPQHDPAALCHGYLSTGGATELPSPPFPPQSPGLSAPESPCAGPGPARPGGPWLQMAPLWGSRPAGGAVEQGKGCPGEGYQLPTPPHGPPQGNSAQQRLDSFTNAFANHSLRTLRGSAPSLGMPLPFCLTRPTDVVLQQLLSHKPQQAVIQPMGSQQTRPAECQPMSSCSQRPGFGVSSQHGYLLQEQYRPLQEQQDMNYLLYSCPTTNPGPQTSNPSHLTTNPTLQHSNPTQTHTVSTHTFANSAHQNSHLSPTFSPPYSQGCNIHLYSQPEPVPSIPQTPCYYQSHHQNQNQNHLLDPNQSHLLDQNQNQNQNLHPHRAHSLPPQQSGFRSQMLDEPPPLHCDPYCSDSCCPALLSPAHLSPLDPSPAPSQPQPLLPAATHSPRQRRSEVKFHAPAPPPCCSPGAPQWRQMCSSVQDQSLCQDESVLVKLMGNDSSRLLCSICQKEFKSLPALNGHMRSHGGGVPPKMPLKMGWGSGAGPDRRSRSNSEPLISTSPNGAVLFQSLLRSRPLLGGVQSYTPPPMLCPSREGSGLFNIICPGASPARTPPPLFPPRVLLNRTGSLDSAVKREITSSGEKLVQIKPRINIGPQFQAVVPEVQRPTHTDRDAHKAHPLWSPWGAQEIPANQRVDALLNMACSSILPGGGTNMEFALHCLFQCQGDFMATLDRLLMQKPLRHRLKPLADYHYAGSDNWTLAEKKQLNRAFILHHKDFFLIQKMVKTKTVSQCVEYYYTWKKRLRLGKRQPARPVSLGSERGPHTPKSQEEEQGGVKQEVKAHWSPDLDCPAANQIGDFGCDLLARAANSTTQHALHSPASIRSRPGSAPRPTLERILPSPSLQPALDSAPLPALGSASPSSADPAHIFPCKECGKVFLKIKSRNAHMKTHRQQDDPQDWLLQPVNHPATPTPLPRPANHHGRIQSLCVHREEEEEEEDPFLPVHALLQMEAGPFISVEEL
ncbi:transcriptional-regulating factor 1 [Conger conger]|uniref:transcriptional-regulating factor 1 n=1 Tax=Conger conger TaxID=82655 RepID=UPI002A5AB0D0|nr:transcriptional-regulating factor 1 [Conger conger]XP_061109700.1 transcriptional-regulating factor 1 [Conger conger]